MPHTIQKGLQKNTDGKPKRSYRVVGSDKTRGLVSENLKAGNPARIKLGTNFPYGDFASTVVERGFQAGKTATHYRGIKREANFLRETDFL